MIKAFNKVKSCIFTFWTGFQVDFTPELNMPITYNDVLDETLNTAQIKLTDLRENDFADVTMAFEPYTEVTITFENENGVEQETALHMLIAHDDCKMQRKDKGGSRSYEHVIKLVEKTKELERLSVDTLIFTNPIPRKYDSNAYAEWNIE